LHERVAREIAAERKRAQPVSSPTRPAPARIEWHQAERVTRLAYTRQQAADVLGVSISTIDRRLVPTVATVMSPGAND
jgi:hypothetical protein